MLFHLYLRDVRDEADTRDKIVTVGIVLDVIYSWASGLKISCDSNL